MAVHDQRALAPSNCFVELAGLLANIARLTIFLDVFFAFVPNDQSAIAVQQLIPNSLPLLVAGSKAGAQDHHLWIERVNDVDAATNVVRLNRVQHLRNAGVVIATPSRHLAAANVHVGVRISFVDSVHPHLQRIRVGNIHPLFQVSPRGIVIIGPLHGLIGGQRHHQVPVGKVRTPLLIQRAQAAVLRLQPAPHRHQRFIGEIEVPRRFQLRNPGLIRQAIKVRPVRCESLSSRNAAIMDELAVIRVPETWVSLESCQAVRIFLVEFLGLDKRPPHRTIRTPAMIFRVVIGRKAFRIPAHVVIDQEIRQRHIAAGIGRAVDPQLLQLGNKVRRIVLPHHDDVVFPPSERRLRNKVCLGGFTLIVGRTLDVFSIQRQVHMKMILHGDSQRHINWKCDVGLIQQIGRQHLVFHCAAEAVGPDHM